MRARLARLRRVWSVAFRYQSRNLLLTAWIELAFLIAGTSIAKWLLVSFSFSEATVLQRLWLSTKVLSVDFVVTGLAGLVLLALRRRRAIRRRTLAAVALVAAAQILLFATFAHAEFFASWGSPLTFDLLQLAPNLAGYILLVGVSNMTGTLTVWAVLALSGLLGLPLVQLWCARALRGRAGTRGFGAATACVLVLGGTLAAVPPGEHREATLRDVNLVSMVVPRWRAPTDVPQHPRSKADQALLDALAGPVDRTAADALEPLRGRRPNIVLWVWESVSSDHLAALHPLGRARTPHLDRMMAEGSLNFSTAYAECPLTVQTTWALLTGRRPPAMPFVFVADTDLPPHGPALPGELRRAGYRTACFYASYAHMWGTRRLFDIEPFDLFEDADAFVDRGGYAVSGIGVQDDAIVDRGLEWVSAQPRTQPFFLMLWNTETHRPYTWAGMPDEVRSRPDYDRYLAAVERGDQLLGRLRDGLAARGVLDDTVLVVVGDHGEAFGRAPRTWHWNHASQVFEDEVHVPFVFIHPALRAATVSMPCTHADLFPTLMDMAGVPLPSGLSGRSLARPAVPGPLFMRATLWWPLAIRTGRYKLILPGPTVPPLLYDIVDDPEERQDLTWTRPDTARAMRSALQQWHSDRFRSDPTFGYKMPSLARLFVRPMTRRSDQWERPPGSPPHR